MDETQAILDAMSMDRPEKTRKRVMNEIEPMPGEEEDVLMRMAKREARRERARKKPLRKWTMTDFMRYLNTLLSVHCLHLEKMSARDREIMAGLHDKFVDHLGEKMDNMVLRNYLDWWVSCFAASMHERRVYVGNVAQENTVEKFLRRYKDDIKDYRTDSEQPSEQNVDEYALFELGGLSMLLMSKGIVSANRVLKERNKDNIFSRISNTLMGFSKDVVLSTMEATLEGAPYNDEDSVDFISLARPALNYYAIKKFDNMRYQNCFPG